MADRVRALGALAVLTLAVSLPACLSPVPLDPNPQADLDAAVLGRWRCLPPAAEEDDEPANLTVARLRDRVYAIEFGEAGKEPDSYEAHASRIGERTIVNVREVSGHAGDKPWDFVAYAFPRPNVLTLEIAGEEAFKGVEMTPAGLRGRMAKPGAFTEFAVCVPLKKKTP